MTILETPRVTKATSAQASVIAIRDLRVNYGSLQAVRGLSLDVEQGEIYGLLGPNGAGKTTTLSVIEGLRKPDGGSVTVRGYDVLTQPREVKRQIGISLQTNAFVDTLNIAELVQFYAGLYGVRLDRTEAYALLDRFGLGDKTTRRPAQLSGGQQQRVSLAIAVANDPHIVILDEPSTGLDPHARRAVWDVIRQMQAAGKTILLTTHYMEEAQELCHRIGIIDQGTVVAAGTPAELISSLEQSSLITVSAALPLDAVRALPGVQTARTDGGELTISTRDFQETLVGLTALATRHGITLHNLTTRQPTLDDVFLAYTGRSVLPAQAIRD